MTATKSSQVRQQLKHPVIDADGHWLDLFPIFYDYLAEVAGPAAVDAYRSQHKRTTHWYAASPEQRARERIHRQSWWTLPTSTTDRTAAMVPGLFYDRLDQWGVDVALVYPTLGLIILRTMDDRDLEQAVIRAYNTMAADMFRPYADRIIPAASISLNSPADAVEQLEHAHSLGLKMILANGTTMRRIGTGAGDDNYFGSGFFADRHCRIGGHNVFLSQVRIAEAIDAGSWNFIRAFQNVDAPLARPTLIDAGLRMPGHVVDRRGTA